MVYANCKTLCDENQKLQNKMEKAKSFLAKNEEYYNKYKNDISKKIKVSGNILFISTQIENLKLLQEQVALEQKKIGCQKCN